MWTREERIALAENVMARKIVQGWRFEYGARNRLLFAIQSANFKTWEECIEAVASLIVDEQALEDDWLEQFPANWVHP